MTSLLPPGDDDFDRGPTTPPERPASGYDRDFARAQQDRDSSGLVSLAYFIVRGVQALFGVLRRT